MVLILIFSVILKQQDFALVEIKITVVLGWIKWEARKLLETKEYLQLQEMVHQLSLLLCNIQF